MVDVRVEHLLYAARQQRDARATRPAGGHDRRQGRHEGKPIRQQREHRPERRGEQRRRGPGHPPESCRDPEERGGLQRAEQDTAPQPLNARPRVLLGPRPERHEQFAVLDTRGTRGHAREASQATIDVGQRVLQREVTLEHIFHEHDAAAWRVHLLAEHAVGRAGGQTEPTVHAGFDGARHRGGVRVQRVYRDVVLHGLPERTYCTMHDERCIRIS